MPRRIEVELTSRRDDGTWTWRAAGAREPKGSVDAALVPAEASTGTVLTAEIEIDIEGIIVTAIASKKSTRSEPQRLEIIGGSRSDESLVTTTLVRRGRDDRGGRRDRGERGERSGRPDGDRGGRPRGDGDRRSRPEGGGGDQRRRPPFERKAPLEAKPRAKRLRSGRAHRNTLIAELPEEHKPIAEELFRGGPPAVRTALDKQNEGSKAEGKPEIDPAPLMLLAERLWPQVRTAEWQDRAEGALADVDELDLRDLRSVVVASDSAARDDTSREMASKLREALNRRVDEEHAKWLLELAELVADGRIVGALRRSSRPPKAGAPLPSELATTMAAQAGEALTAEVTPDRWAVVLDALSFSPVRTSVTPASIPEDKPEELLVAVRKSAARLPAIAALFGIEPDAPPSGGRSRRSPRPSGRRGPERASGSPRIPPPPVLPTTPTAAANVDDGPQQPAEAPAAETPTAEAPAAETATAEAPAAETPTAEAPAAETPTGQVAATSDDSAADSGSTPVVQAPPSLTPAADTGGSPDALLEYPGEQAAGDVAAAVTPSVSSGATEDAGVAATEPPTPSNADESAAPADGDGDVEGSRPD